MDDYTSVDRPRGRTQRNPLDRLADELAEWADQVSTQVADSLLGGFAAPGAAQLSEQQKLEYYTRQLFDPATGQPNLQGRVQEMERLGPEGFAQVYAEVISHHPEWAPPPEEPYAVGYRQPTDVPGVLEVTDEPEVLRPTGAAGVSEIVSGPPPRTVPTGVPGVSEVIG